MRVYRPFFARRRAVPERDRIIGIPLREAEILQKMALAAGRGQRLPQRLYVVRRGIPDRKMHRRHNGLRVVLLQSLPNSRNQP